MSDLRKAAEMALKDLTTLCHAQAYDTVQALRQALSQPEQESVKCMYPYCETASGCDGPCSKPLATPVDAVNISQERVDETAKREHEPVAWMYEWEDEYNCWNKAAHLFRPSHSNIRNLRPLYTAPPKREWVGLTDEERERATGWSVEHIESYLKEKNGE